MWWNLFSSVRDLKYFVYVCTLEMKHVKYSIKHFSFYLLHESVNWSNIIFSWQVLYKILLFNFSNIYKFIWNIRFESSRNLLITTNKLNILKQRKYIHRRVRNLAKLEFTCEIFWGSNWMQNYNMCLNECDTSSFSMLNIL